MQGMSQRISSVTRLIRYRFHERVPPEDVEASLVLAILTVETIHTPDELRESGGHAFDASTRTLVMSAEEPAALALNQIFHRLLEREFGRAAFEVELVDATGNQFPPDEEAP